MIGLFFCCCLSCVFDLVLISEYTIPDGNWRWGPVNEDGKKRGFQIWTKGGKKRRSLKENSAGLG